MYTYNSKRTMMSNEHLATENVLKSRNKLLKSFIQKHINEHLQYYYTTKKIFVKLILIFGINNKENA